ncbi:MULTISPECIES: arsenosugar biosynthesis radical SAM (seleno)protein ArsS [unclassified Prochlorococcus]|uniref:arsenosugar biosynthesis radical SAM (seleno)protein ArsS n=1 Tax=unclassified Prochlorococcus TaxID=2627481 RepID=UPI000533B795|nr:MULTISPECIES: arsenosugar biosynthesis radical SAM (seleno)protein ArsS [unclassified Prochlorococcus]KGG15110.1 hypothetical protein EV06_0975 [Prochlorococcus sp. MIT 0602]KGG17382.1 hypothetical protein EV07_0821 [Prochlorococcus sp. MIT 0603]
MNFPKIQRDTLETLQVNLGYKCNQACLHCHVNASPLRTEMMDEYNISLIPEVIRLYNIKVLDITGGAPEMHPLFIDLIQKVSGLDIKIIDRCNLTILLESGHENTAQTLAENNVSIIASLPCYEESNVDAQRGKNVFQKSIYALQMLNRLGYGKQKDRLTLDLVYNPIGPILPPSQVDLEKRYRDELKRRYSIEFSKLLVLANMPINRFSLALEKEGKLESYKSLLKENHNEANLKSVMCKSTISVDWKGNLYDCDFNQQLGIKSQFSPNTLKGLSKGTINSKEQEIKVGDHCFGCTAGNGSSCGGALT